MCSDSEPAYVIPTVAQHSKDHANTSYRPDPVSGFVVGCNPTPASRVRGIYTPTTEDLNRFPYVYMQSATRLRSGAKR